MDDFNSRIVIVHSSVAQIDDRLLGAGTNLFEWDRCRFDLRRQSVAIVRVA